MANKTTKSKKYSVRIYNHHDKDLICLFSKGFDLIQAIYVSLKGFSKGDYFVINTPKDGDPSLYDRRHSIGLSLYLNKEKDADIIQILDSISPGWKNKFIKNILRFYLCCPILDEYVDEENDLIKKNIEIFKKNRRRVNLNPKKRTRRAKTVQKSDFSAEKQTVNEQLFFSTFKNEEKKEVFNQNHNKQEEGLSAQEEDEIFNTFSSFLF